MFGPLSAPLQCLRNGRPAQCPQPVQPDRRAADLDSHRVSIRPQATRCTQVHASIATLRRICAIAQRWEDAEKGQLAGLPQNVGFSYPGGAGKPIEIGSRTEGESCDGQSPVSGPMAWRDKTRRDDPKTDRMQPALARARGKEAWATAPTPRSPRGADSGAMGFAPVRATARVTRPGAH